MPNVKEDKQALDWIIKNPQDARSPQIAEKLGLDSEDVRAWDYTQKNPQDERSTLIRNQIFTKVANTRPAIEEMGVRAADRFVVKNLLSGEPKVQAEYLKRKGFIPRIVGNEVEVRRPEESVFRKVDPAGLDLWDATDIIGDLAEAAATALATGAKAVGAIGAPVTGGAALAAGAALGGVATGGFEAARQAVAKAVGVREEISPGRITQAALVGATIPGITKLGGAILRGGGKILGSLARQAGVRLKPNAAEIKAAAEEIGATATPGQLFESKLVEKLESAQLQSTGKIGGTLLRRQVEANRAAAKETAELIIRDASEKTAFEAGQEVGERLLNSVNQKLQPAEVIYNKYETIFRARPFKPNISDLSQNIDGLIKEFKFSDAAVNRLTSLKNKLPEIQNLDDLKRFRSTIGSEFRTTQDGNIRRSLGDLYAKTTDLRSKSLIDQAKKKGDDFFEVAKNEIENADSIYRSTIEEAQSLISGRTPKGSPKRVIQEFLEKTPEIDRINKILKTNDPKKITKVKSAFPDAFNELKGAKIAEIAQRGTVGGELNAKRLVKIIDKLPPETRNLLFDRDQITKTKALKTFLDNIPERLGASGTPEGIEFFRLFNVIKQVNSLGRQSLSRFITSPQLEKDVFSKLGRALQSDKATAISVFGVRQAIPPDERNQGLILPAQGLRLPQQQGAR